MTSPADVAELVDPLGTARYEQPELQDLPAREYDGLSGVDLRVYDALPVGRAAHPASIASVAGLDRPSVLASLAPARPARPGGAQRRGLAALAPGRRLIAGPTGGSDRRVRPPARAPAPAGPERRAALWVRPREVSVGA